MAVTRVSFVAGTSGDWAIERVVALKGDPLAGAPALQRVEGAELLAPPDAVWSLHGVRSNERYLERGEKDRLVPVQAGLGRADSQRGALIPMRKSDAWWDLAQDERRALFETRSRHIEIGAAYLPAIARRLYHCRDLGGPFDFLTWFEFHERDAPAFDELLGRLRDTEEWRYVDREVEIRVRRA
jgi:Chlorite dismutase